MRRALALSWALGTSAGVFLGLWGVQLVTSGIRDGRVSPLSHPEVLQALAAGRIEAVPEEPADLPVVAPVPAPPDESLVALPAPSSKTPAPRPVAAAAPAPAPAAPTPTTTPPATVSPAAATPATAATTAPPPAPPAPPSPATPKPEPVAPQPSDASKGPGKSEAGSTVRTITSEGGTVAVRYKGDRVELVWARPQPGYDVNVKSEGPKYVVVRFSNGSHESWVVAYYDDEGRPQQKVVEREDGEEDPPADAEDGGDRRR